MPSSAIQVLFVANGLDALKSAIGGVQAALDALAKGTKTTTEAAAKVSAGAAASGVKAHDKAERDKTQSTKREERAREQERKAAERAEANFLKAGMSAVSAAERERTEAVKQGSRDRLRIAEDEHRKQQALIQTRARMAGSVVGGAVNRTMGMAGRLAATAAAVGGGFSIVDALQSGVSEEKQAGIVMRNAQTTGGLSNQQVRDAARASAISTGTTSEENIGGINRFVEETGNLKEAVGLIQDLAKYSVATGAALEDVGTLSGIAFGKLNGDLGQTKEAIKALLGQTKTGAISAANLGQYGGRIIGSASLYEGNAVKNIETVGAFTQIAKRYGGKVDAAEASEASSRIFGEIAQHADDFEALLGHSVRGKSGKLLPGEQLLIESLVKLKGDITQIPKLFGRQAGGVELGLADVFLRATGGKTDQASLAKGKAAAEKTINDLRVPLTQGQIDQGVAEHLAETNGKLAIATEKFHDSMRNLQLQMPGLIDKFTQLIPAIEKFIDFLVSNPWTGLGGLVGASIVAEIGKAAIGQATVVAVTAMIKKLLGGGGGDLPSPADVPIPGGARGVATVLRNFGPAAGLAAGAAATLGTAYYLQSNAEDKGASAAQALLSQGTGGTDAEKRARLDKVMALTDRIETEDKRSAAVQTPEEDVTGADLAARGAAESLVALKREADELRHALSGATDAAGQMASIQPPRTREPSATHAP